MIGESTEKEPEITFEHDCPVEELASFLSQDSGQGEDRRIRHTPESAEKRINGFMEKWQVPQNSDTLSTGLNINNVNV